MHPVVEELFDAIATRDVTAYSEGHEHVLSIERTREAQTERARIEAAIKEAAPRLVSRIVSTLRSGILGCPLGRKRRWSVADSWLEQRSDFDYQRGLWRKRHEAEASIGRLVADAASLRAWAHFFDRLSPAEANALRSWREAVRAMGKGTGKSAKMARLRRDARRYMDACRDAIPIWIMPRYLVAEMIDPAPGRYDLVIVDEASPTPAPQRTAGSVKANLARHEPRARERRAGCRLRTSWKQRAKLRCHRRGAVAGLLRKPRGNQTARCRPRWAGSGIWSRANRGCAGPWVGHQLRYLVGSAHGWRLCGLRAA